MEQRQPTLNRKGPRQGLFRSIGLKLITSFSLLFVVTLVLVELAGIRGILFTPNSGRERQQTREAFKSLALIADLKKERLLRWLQERRDNIRVAAGNKMVESNTALLHTAMHEFTTGGAKGDGPWALVRQEKSYQNLVDYLETVRLAYGVYDEIYIADLGSGTIFISTDETDLGSDVSQQPFFSAAQRSRFDYVSDIKIDPGSRRPTLYISHAITDEAGEMIAVLVMAVNVDDIIKPMLHTGEGLGAQGEALLVNQDAIILTSLKHPLAGGSIARPLAYQIKAQPAILAAGGEEGIIESDDYRGEPVLAAYRHLRLSSDWGWGMVVKRDKSEFFAPLQQDIVYTFWIGLAGILWVIGLTIVIAKSLVRPIRSLGRTALQVAEGNLAARAPVTTADEVGTLAKTFNTMVERLQHWHEALEVQVQAHTADLRASEEIFRSFTENAPDYIVQVDCQRKILFINRVYEGMSIEEMIGSSILDWLPKQFCSTVNSALGRVFDSAEPQIAEYCAPDQQGNMIWYSANIGPIAVGDRITSVILVIRDITKRVQAETELRKHREHLEELVAERTAELNERVAEVERLNRGVGNLLEDLQAANRRVTQTARQLEGANAELESFAYSVSHDLRAPLRAIDGFSYALLEDYGPKLDAEALHYLQRVRAAAQRMAQLIDDMLKLSRAGRREMNRRPVNLSELARNTSAELQQANPERRVEFKIQEGLTVYGDTRLLEIVMTNLLGNAWKFTAEQPRTRIEFGAQEKRGRQVYYVRDNGAGFDMTYADKLFTPFQRLHSETDFPGNGIGLATVQRIIHRHGGQVWAAGQVEQGATFFFTL